MIRKCVFWMHLCAGVGAGLVILMMSVTGTVLTYERQLQVWEDKGHYYSEPGAGNVALGVDEILAAANLTDGFTATSVQLNSNPAAPVVVRMGRSQTQFLNPYSAEIYTPHEDTYSQFFSWVRTLHRWFTLTGDNRDIARDVTGVSNLMFLFLLLSGMYLWLPKVFMWATLKTRVWFNPLNSNSAARDFNWHHVFSFWAALPLLVIVPTASVFHYTWANNLVYQLVGDEPPVRGQASEVETPMLSDSVAPLSLQTLFDAATQYSDTWKTLSLNLPDPDSRDAVFTIDEGNGGQPHKRHSLTLNRATAETVVWAPFSTGTSGYKARRWVRYLHTGEALGIAGQTIAGLASSFAAILVWTGLSLALRRFFRWRLRKQQLAA
ncbi:MAG: PepSY-associated TM helix domain-containing protein [Pseudohongiellaceae bacterium]